MRTDKVEILSDQTNAAVMRHPGRKFPGILVQGDTMSNFCRLADDACRRLKEGDIEEAYEELNELRNMLWGQLTHYKSVLSEHDIPLPFSEQNA